MHYSIQTHVFCVGGLPILNFIVYRTGGAVLGAGFQSFISDWDKVTAAVSYSQLLIIILITNKIFLSANFVN